MNASELATKPWRGIADDALALAAGVPSMLNAEEARLYFWLAKHLARTDGHIVDLGCFAGGSTAYLAEGNRHGGGTAQIFAFDQFRASTKVKERQLYSKGVSRFDGRDILPLSRELLAPWSPKIEFRKGRIEEGEWQEGPISLLILDASKTADTMDQMAEIFFPHLIPGVSIIVQQDELHWKEPWIAVQMEKLKACFEPLCHVPGGAMAYRCVKTVNATMLKEARVGMMNDATMIDALSGSNHRLRAFGLGRKINRQIKAIELNPGQRKAWKFVNRVPRQ